jgi:riboflavin synthase
MFTGLVEGTGRISFVRRQGQGMDLSVEVRALQGDMAIGDSVSLSGCCATVTRLSGGRAEFRMTRETLERTWFGQVEAGTEVNLERCLTPTTRLGGHIVQGHVDGMGEVTGLDCRSDGTDLTIRVPQELVRYMVEKGSVAIDGVSLTIARIHADLITIALIPHSMGVTTLGKLRPGSRVNLEVDILAKYVEKLLGQTSGLDAGC